MRARGRARQGAMHVRAALILCLAVATGGCAARAPAASESAGGAADATAAEPAPVMVQSTAPATAGGTRMIEPERVSRGAEEHAALRDAERELEHALAARVCGDACDAGQRVCALKDRICAIAARHPEDVEIGARCTDGSERCERVSARLAAECACGG